MRKFILQRDVDETDVSGTGPVADGVVFGEPGDCVFPDGVRLHLPPGWVRLKWRGPKSSTALWASVDMMLAVHGHNGLTRVVWVDEDSDGQAAADAGEPAETPAEDCFSKFPVYVDATAALTQLARLTQSIHTLAVAARTLAVAVGGGRDAEAGT